MKRDDDVPPEPEFKCVCPFVLINYSLSHLSRPVLSYSPHVLCESRLIALNYIPYSLTLPCTDGDQGHFPVYEQDASTIREIEEQYAEAIKDPTKHYDASKENRTAGAGFYQFSADEETRARQMEELKRMRQETETTRKESGIEDGAGGKKCRG